jgi:hypothetical protein
MGWRDYAIATLTVGITATTYGYMTMRRSRDIAAQNWIAAQDTTRLVQRDKENEAVVYARAIRQIRVSLDKATQRALKAEGRAKARASTGVTVQVGSMVAESSHALLPNPEGTGEWLEDSVRLQGPPITGRISVAIKPDVAVWNYALQPDPVTLGYTLACGDKGAVVAIKVPDWASVSIDSGAVDPEVCHKKSSRFFLGAGLGAAATLVTLMLLGGN